MKFKKKYVLDKNTGNVYVMSDKIKIRKVTIEELFFIFLLSQLGWLENE